MRLSWVVRIMVGKFMITKVNAPAKMLLSKSINWQKNKLPNRP